MQWLVMCAVKWSSAAGSYASDDVRTTPCHILWPPRIRTRHLIEEEHVEGVVEQDPAADVEFAAAGQQHGAIHILLHHMRLPQ